MSEIVVGVLVSVLLFAVAWFFELVVHEASHLFFAWFFCGYYPVYIRLYPIKWGSFAECGWSLINPDRPTMFERLFRLVGINIEFSFTGIIYMSPLIIGFMMFIIFLSLSYFSFYFIPFAIFGVGDCLLFIWTVFFGSNKSDGKKYVQSDECVIILNK